MKHTFNIVGTVVNSEERKGLTKSGNKPYFLCTYTVLCEGRILRVTQASLDGTPFIPVENGKDVKVDIKAGMRDNGVIPLDGAIEPATA